MSSMHAEIKKAACAVIDEGRREEVAGDLCDSTSSG